MLRVIALSCRCFPRCYRPVKTTRPALCSLRSPVAPSTGWCWPRVAFPRRTTPTSVRFPRLSDQPNIMGFDSASDPPSKTAVPNQSSSSDYGGVESTIPRGWSAWFGGSDVRIGPRIAPVIAPLPTDNSSDSDLNSTQILLKQKQDEENCAIQYRTCSWQKVGFCSLPPRKLDRSWLDGP